MRAASRYSARASSAKWTSKSPEIGPHLNKPMASRGLLLLAFIGAAASAALVGPAAHVGRGRGPLPARAAHVARAGNPLMGVPKFFRWLTERFPQITSRISEGHRGTAGVMDNFYLDMNGIIHTCTHGDDVGAEADTMTEDEQVAAIFAYVDRLVAIARPRKLIYLAIDGVAPRAKMNQQRSRRYRVPRELAAAARRVQENSRMRRGAAEAYGEATAPAASAEGEAEGEPFDSNCITPGTAFLHNLGLRCEEYIAAKQRDDPVWAKAKVIFSSAAVEGEGEHKIMDYIREVKANAEPGEETRHCMYGLDADLIMLGLVTHEKHFVLLREKQKFQKGRLSPRGRNRRGQKGRADGGVDIGRDGSVTPTATTADDEDFVFLEIEPLRAALSGTMKPTSGGLDFAWEEERAVDDFVFMCMLVGNDFIPGMPHLDVADGALNLLLRTYTDMIPSLGGYLTDKSSLHFGRFERFVSRLSETEPYLVAKKLTAGARPPARRERGRAPNPTSDLAPGEHRRRYYLQKLGLHPNDADGRRALVRSYLEGLCWCLAYYHDGCRSWNWRAAARDPAPARHGSLPPHTTPSPNRRFYPDFYAPLATDMVHLDRYKISLERGRPFPPLAQLLSVLPPQARSRSTRDPSAAPRPRREPDASLDPQLPTSVRQARARAVPSADARPGLADLRCFSRRLRSRPER